MVEVGKRIRSTMFVCQKLKVFWIDELVSKREKITIYDSLVSSKLLYGLETLPLTESCLKKLNAFHLRGLRRILRIPTTHIDRQYSNTKVIELANEEANKTSRKTKHTKPKVTKLVSEVLGERSMHVLGEIMRSSPTDLRRQVTFRGDTPHINLPRENRVGRPRIHWTTSNLARVWNSFNIHNRSPNTANTSFNHSNEIHLQLLHVAALLREF